MKVAFILSAVAWIGCSHTLPVQTPSASVRGHLLLVGGGPIPAEVTTRFVELAGGRGRAVIAVFPTASAVATTGPSKVAELESFGARAFVVTVSRGVADHDSLVSKLESATGIWFAGGDQSRITAALMGSRVLEAIRRRWEAGAVIGGTSAGAAAMSSVMITGDERRPGGERRDTTSAFITIERDNVITSPGLGFIGDAIIDQHFLRRRRHNRLISLVLENSRVIGAGIDESTAIDVFPGGRWEVIGASSVMVLDARGGRTYSRAHTIGAADVKLHVLPAGSIFDSRTGRVARLGNP